jgi:hypothetical protein
MTSSSHQIDLSPLMTGLEQPLQLITDPDTRERLRAYVNAARPQVERAAFDALSQLVEAFNETCAEQRGHLEYSGGILRFKVDEAQDGGPEPSFNDGDLERVTLRLPRDLKELIDSVAMRQGVSANNWYVRALSRMMARHFRESMRENPRDAGQGRRRGGFYRGRGGHRRDHARGIDD